MTHPCVKYTLPVPAPLDCREVGNSDCEGQ
jgi:hypothetical protein